MTNSSSFILLAKKRYQKGECVCVLYERGGHNDKLVRGL